MKTVSKLVHLVALPDGTVGPGELGGPRLLAPAVAALLHRTVGEGVHGAALAHPLHVVRGSISVDTDPFTGFLVSNRTTQLHTAAHLDVAELEPVPVCPRDLRGPVQLTRAPGPGLHVPRGGELAAGPVLHLDTGGVIIIISPG